MSTQTEKTRKTLEAEVINATMIASNQILSCFVINHINPITKLKNKFASNIMAACLASTSIFGLTWFINIIGPQPNSPSYNWPLIIPASLSGLALYVVKTLHDILLPPNRERAAHLPTNTDGLLAMRDWFRKSFKVPGQIICSIIIGLFAIITSEILSNNFTVLHSNLGFDIGVFFCMFVIGNGVYCALIIPTLASTASGYRMNLFPYSPASTTIVRIASAGFAKLALANGLVATLVIALIFTFRPWQDSVTFNFALSWLLFGWGTAIYSFVFPHYHISKIIVREKEIQTEKLEALIARYHNNLEKLNEKEMRKMSKIIDLREQVANSSNTSIGFRGWRDFASALLLPLISFVAGVVDIPTLINKF